MTVDGAAETGVPHFPQNIWPGDSGAPHLLQYPTAACWVGAVWPIGRSPAEAAAIGFWNLTKFSLIRPYAFCAWSLGMESSMRGSPPSLRVNLSVERITPFANSTFAMSW